MTVLPLISALPSLSFANPGLPRTPAYCRGGIESYVE